MVFYINDIGVFCMCGVLVYLVILVMVLFVYFDGIYGENECILVMMLS